jgi:hypothetical protein
LCVFEIPRGITATYSGNHGRGQSGEVGLPVLRRAAVAMVARVSAQAEFDMGDSCAAIYGLCGACMGPAGRAGMPSERMRRIEEGLRLLSGRTTPEAPVQ